MEKQSKLTKTNQKGIVALQPNKITLENEKENFIMNLCEFLEPLNFDQLQIMGRPKSNMKDIIKALCMMSYNGMSYRRSQTDLKWMREKELISFVPPRSTMNDYVNDLETIKILERLIQFSALFFQENEDTLILDSTWFGLRMYSGGYKKVHDKVNVNFDETRKLHIACLKNSKIICCARATTGERHDSPLVPFLVKNTIKNGFGIKTVIADAGYRSKDHHVLFQELGVRKAFVDFTSGVTGKRAKSQLWRDSVKRWKEEKEIWHNTYRFRVIVEGIFSAIKRKNLNWLRARKPNSQDVEILLKCLVYNLTVIGKYS